MTRVAIVDREKCQPAKCGDYLCVKLCPVNRMGEECITAGEDKKARIDEALCTGCGICPKRCPFDAITIVNLPEKLRSEPIHRYGENMFELFNIPVPVAGKIIGVIGKNGIGKSTAFKILADMLKPNFGDWEHDSLDEHHIIDYFKGTEAQGYFESKHTISFKPQQIEMIPKQFDGTVRALLSKADQTESMEDVAEKLHLTKVIDSSVKNLSGGELQKLAVAAATLKKADILMYDEPTSFLDIKQRLNLSTFIREQLTDDKGIMIVEHDLIVLDSMTDLVHILYGVESAYGIASGVKVTREGINAFLDGFLREENVRFRDKPIAFTKGQTEKSVRDIEVCSWKDVEKELGLFRLNCKDGVLYKSEVVGILGENGIGKTSFVKMVAGVIKPDKGEIKKSVKVSYKPQFLNIKEDDIVMNYLSHTIEHYHNLIIRPLCIEPLYDKQLSQLSGGELQRVSVAKALSEEAELFLLDEPSAYLDVEQRVAVAKLIRTIAQDRAVTILVVDHDLMFLDYVSHRLMVFDGEPARSGTVYGPFSMEDGMNHFLKGMGVTFRRDHDSNRPRANKPDSVKDREQKKEGKFYY